jgi:hypothetical protein
MNRKRFRSPLLAQAGLLMVALLLLAGPVAHAAGGVTAVLSTAGPDVTVGDPIRLVLTVKHPAGYQVLPPRLEQTWGELTVKAVSPASTKANPDGTETTTLGIDARLFKPGAFQTPSLDVTVTDGSGNLIRVTAAAVPVTVASVLKQGDTALRDIKAQAVLPLPASWPWVLAASLAVLALAAALFWAIRRRLAPAPDRRLPHERALDELSAVETMRLPQQGRFKEHATLVSDCIRGYVERAFGIPAAERTTGEIEADLTAAGFTPGVQAAVLAFLEDSDIIKFTTLTPGEATAAGLLLQARAIVQATAPQPAEPVRKADAGRRRRLPVSPEPAPEAAL